MTLGWCPLQDGLSLAPFHRVHIRLMEENAPLPCQSLEGEMNPRMTLFDLLSKLGCLAQPPAADLYTLIGMTQISITLSPNLQETQVKHA